MIQTTEKPAPADPEPASPIVIDAQGATIGIIGDHATQTNYFVTVVVHTDRFWTEPLPDTPPVPRLPQTRLGQLLAARHRVAPYLGRGAERHALELWRNATETARAALLVHAPGGMGKTRLALEFAHASRSAGWAVAVAHHATDPSPNPAAVPDVTRARGLLLLVDYAERWPREDLTILLRDISLRYAEAAVPVRVLLLARPAGWWWQSLENPLTKLEFAVDELPLRSPPPLDRAELFDAARDRFAELLGVSEPQRLRAAGSLDDPAYAVTLTVQMAALAAVDAAARSDRPPAHPEQLSRYLLTRETDYWTAAYENHRITTPPAMMGRLVGLAALTGAVDHRDALSIVARAGLEPGAAQQLLDDHRICYPPTVPDAALQQLLPDRLAEDFLASRLSAADDPWLRQVPDLLAGSLDPRIARYAPHMMTMLIETAHRAPGLTTTVLQPLIRAHPGVAIGAGGATLLRLAELPGVDPTTLHTVESAIPQARRVDLDIATAALSTALLPHRLAASADPADRAHVYRWHADRLDHAGRRAEALEASAAAIASLRALAADDPGTHGPELAAALDNLAVLLSGFGQHDEALEPAQEALRRYRALAAADPQTHEPELALALLNYTNRLSTLGRHREALDTIGEAVDRYRTLARTDSHTHDADLASALVSLGNRLGQLGRHREALSAGAEAVDRYRVLAQADPAAHEPDLALALANSSIQLVAAGEWQQALPVAAEAADRYRHLAEINPAAYEPILPTALGSLAEVLMGSERHEDALPVAREAVERFRTLAATNPGGHEPNLAWSSALLGAVLAKSGRSAAALEVTTEAVALNRRLAQANPAYDQPLARTLVDLSLRLRDCDRNQDALAAAEEAVTRAQRLVGADTAHEPELADALWAFAHACGDIGDRRAEAIAAARAAVDIYVRLDRATPGPYVADLSGVRRILAELSGEAPSG
ncbi:tetratricopeptide repeat protein [Nocardia aurantia]|uniref:Tetratricopeptide repeat protein n=1 Tax=Nocardia aurantia TaxID=2585199 RepID=A0A7K0DYB2_9NOCA|nr:tetratricopeptide repeat protein [Nocardia aurantia]MQY30695.1 hypothetical protein [Nocardia aurantia]